MTEAEWQAATDPTPMQDFPMLDIVGGRASERKLRLFASACCRQIWHLLSDERSRRAVEVAELYADGVATCELLDGAGIAAEEAFDEAAIDRIDRAEPEPSPTYLREAAAKAAWHVSFPPGRTRDGEHLGFGIDNVHVAVEAVTEAVWRATPAGVPKRTSCAHLFRDIFGNPFRPVTFLPEWRTSNVVALAQQMYDARDFSAMPILADALQDAGCDNDDILSHCRGSEPHVRGCWVVDAVLNEG